MKPRTLIIIIAVLVVIFFIGIGAGISNNNSEDGISLSDIRDADWRQSLDEALTRKIDTGELVLQAGAPESCAFTETQLTVVGTCVWEIGGATLPLTRRLALQLTSGSGTNFSLVQPDQPDIRPELENQQVQIDIFSAGGTLEISCGDQAGCIFTLL